MELAFCTFEIASSIYWSEICKLYGLVRQLSLEEENTHVQREGVQQVWVQN